MLSLFLSSLSLTTQQNMAPSTTQVASKFLTLILMYTNKYCLISIKIDSNDYWVFHRYK